MDGITPGFFNFLFANSFSIKFLYFFIISFLFPYLNLFVSIFTHYNVHSNSVTYVDHRHSWHRITLPLFYFQLYIFIFNKTCCLLLCYFISFSFNLTCLCPYSYNLMLISTYMCRPQALVARNYPPLFLTFCFTYLFSIKFFISFLFPLVFLF